MFRLRKIAFLLMVGGVAGATGAFAQSGTFTFVTGDVNVQRPDGQRVPVTRGTAVRSGDSIVTGERAMAQLTMVDQARISLRPNTQFQIEQYAEQPDSDQGALLNLVRGTLRTFTGLIASRSRDKFVMKTKVATVGIRGSGNVLFAGTAADCDPAKIDGRGTCDITVNHTIEGSHAVTFGDFSAPGLPPQQGGAQTLVTGPGQTVLVTARGNVTYIPTPQFIADSATNPTGAPKSPGGGEGDEDTRNFGPSDSSASTTRQGTATSTPVGNNGLGFTFVDAAGNLVGGDPLQLQDIVVAGAGTLLGQAVPAGIVHDGASLRSYSMYAGLRVDLNPAITGGADRDVHSASTGGVDFSAGRWENAGFGFFGAGSASPVPGSVHWIMAGSGFPSYLSEVLSGTVTYSPVINTSPTNQSNTVGSLTGARLDVNFTNRTLGATIGITMPASGANPGGSWQMNADNVPISFGTFYATTADRLRISNGNGQTSQSNPALAGSLDGSLVGSGLQGAILGYGLSDETSSNSANHNTVTGVIGFQAPAQNAGAPYRDGLVSDPQGVLAGATVQYFPTTNRTEEVTADAQGRVSAFAAPTQRSNGHQNYALGSASIAQFGTDPETGLVWGRWAGGVATVSGSAGTQSIPLDQSSLHYVFSPAQSGPVALPLTGSATYTLVGSTAPTDRSGHTGTLNSATLAANFSARTVDMGVNLTINGTGIVGSAVRVPIYRDQYFSAFRGNVPAGLSVPQQLNISCVPACAGATGSIDGFFTGRSGQGAGMMYNLNGASGAAAFRRPGG